MIVSVIDIGTNTVLLLVADVAEAGTVSPLVYEQRVPRLGRGVDAKRNLSADSMRGVIVVIREYLRLAAPHRPERTVVCGTSAVRDAANREDFAQLIRGETGLELEVLTGEEEALWTFRGALSGIPAIGRATVVDIGGGSTEIITGGGIRIDGQMSLDIGSVRLTERFFRHDPPTDPELKAARTLVKEEIAKSSHFPFAGSQLVGVAGTATALSILAQGLQRFDPAAVTNSTLTREMVEHLFTMLCAMPSSVIRSLSDVMEGRNDVITAGALILREIMAHCQFDGMTVSERGVRYGIAMRETEKGTPH